MRKKKVDACIGLKKTTYGCYKLGSTTQMIQLMAIQRQELVTGRKLLLNTTRLLLRTGKEQLHNARTITIQPMHLSQGSMDVGQKSATPMRVADLISN
jgi:hypothetical protein